MSPETLIARSEVLELRPPTASYSVLGVRVDAVQIPEVVARMEEWIARRDCCRYIAVTGMHGVMEAQHDGEFKRKLNAAGLVVPDGMPLVWARVDGDILQRDGEERVPALFLRWSGGRWRGAR
jgi:N-acetylglucosaminyldiphosphoundecaprenol N-acetyl-beta-D-mannosaminyltransferase